MEKGIKIFIACAVGSATGGMVSLSFYHNIWFCILGILVGSFAGYFSYEFKAVISAVRTAWNNVIGWRPDREAIKKNVVLVMRGFGCFVTLITAVFLFFYLVSCLVALFDSNVRERFLQVEFMTYMSVISLLIFLLITLANCQNDITKVFNRDHDKLTGVYSKMNPIYCYFYLVPKLLLGYACIFLWNAPSFGKATIIIVTKFVKTVFILVYSEERLICLVYGGIGAGVCYFTGHIIIGALAGGLFGLLNYEIVSKRILHLVPKRT